MKQATLAIVSALLLAGCGGGGGSSRLSKSAFDAKANAICDKYTTKINAVPQPKDIKSVPGYIDTVLPLLREGTSKLDELQPPKDLQTTADDWRQVLHDEVKETEALKKAADKGDAAELARIANEISTKDKHGNQLAAQLGAASCAKG
jgi:hypothetical protein